MLSDRTVVQSSNCANRLNICTGLLYKTATPSGRRKQRFRRNIPLPSSNQTSNTPRFNTHFTNNTVKVGKLRRRSVSLVRATSFLALTIFLVRLTFYTENGDSRSCRSVGTNHSDTRRYNSNRSPTRCNNFSFYYPEVYLQLNMFRAFSRPSSGAQRLQ